MIGLTPKQRKLYDFIAATVAGKGVAPSFDEMAKALGHSSKGHVAQFLVILEERGYIRRLPHRARAIEILPPGDAVNLHPEVRAAAVEYCRKEGIKLSVGLAIAARAYFVGDKAA